MDGVTFVENKFPSAFDYQDSSNLNGMAVVDEIQGTSNLVFDAAVGTTDGYTFQYDRIVEKKNTAHTATFDEGWYAGTDPRRETKSAGTMRVTDARQFDKLVRRGTDDSGVARTAEAITNMGRSIISLKAKCIMYGGLPASDGTVDYKQIPGVVSYLDRISDIDKMKQIWEKGESAPFVSENCMAIDNQDGAEYSSTEVSSSISSLHGSDVWTSVYGISWGPNGVFTTFPKNLPGVAGYNIESHLDIPTPVVDKNDGITKMYFRDFYNAESVFGLGIKNRFCASGLRNIYLGHKKKADRFDEMYRVEQNIIQLYNFFRMGETGGTMTFYCSQFLLNQMEQYQKSRVSYMAAPGSNNNAEYGRINSGMLQIADGIVLKSDYAIKTTEPFISEKEVYA